MLTPETLKAIQESEATQRAFSALAQANETLGLAALPDHFDIHDLEKHLPLRRRARGTMSTPFIEPFADYVAAYAENGATVFVSPGNMTATAVLNLGTSDAPGHCDNRATLTPIKTAAYAALTHIAGKPSKQQELAEFLEDWAEFIRTFTETGVVATKHAIAAVRKLTIDTMRKAESSVQNLGASVSALESVQASSSEPIPTVIYFEAQPYADLEKRTFVLRLSINTANDKFPTLTLRVIKEEEHLEEMAGELAAKVKAAIAPHKTLPVLIGSYSTN